MSARRPRRIAALCLMLILTACTPARTPQATPTSLPLTARPAAEAVARPSATPDTSPPPGPTSRPVVASATPDPNALPPGWTRATNEQLSVAIPAGWRAVDLQGEDAQAAFDALQKNDARLAGIIGSAEALQSAAFWAFGPEAVSSEPVQFIDNLNIRRTRLGAQRVTDMQQVIEVLLPEYKKMGLQVTSADPVLRVNARSAARVTYSLLMNVAGGKTFDVRGRQFILATDSDLWVLSFSTTPEREGRMAAEFEAVAHSFVPGS